MAPLALVVATLCMPRSSSGWCVTSRSAPRARGLLDDGEGGVDGEVDPAHRLGQVAGHQPDLVPGLGGRRAGRGSSSTRTTSARVGVHVGPAGLEPTTSTV